MSDRKTVENRYRGRDSEAAGSLRAVGVEYLNARPVVYGLLRAGRESGVKLALSSPAEATRRVFEEEADLGLLPIAAVAAHGGLEVVPGIAIGSRGPVRSVLLVAEQPIELLDDVLLDAASRTSVILARLVLEQRLKMKPRYTARAASRIAPEVKGRRGALLIGDAALQAEGRYAHTLDLGQAWTEWTGLPFVYAVWAAPRGRASEAVESLLQASLREGLDARREIAFGWAKEYGGSAESYHSYLTRNIDYRLDDEAIAGADAFLRRASDAGLLPKLGETYSVVRDMFPVRDVDPRVRVPDGRARVSELQLRSPVRRASLDTLLERGATGVRLSVDDALRLGEEASTHDLGLAADLRRKQLHPDGTVTYIVDRNINYTNVCTTSCRFCAFFRPEGHDEAYVLSREQLAQKIRETEAAGGVQILLQGGLNPELRLPWYEELFRWIKSEFKVALHALSPEEIWHLASLETLPIETVLSRLKAAGMDSLPGGGAEILTDRVRSVIAKAKCTSAEWLEAMRVAHRLGMKSSATMMFGTVDTLLDRVLHLQKIRDLQDETGGFTAFICWDYQSEQGTRLSSGETGTVLYLRTQALARLFLDNVPNIQSSWVTQGPGVGQLALRFGANDLGSVMFEENVVSSAGTTFGMDADTIERHAHEAGFKAARRNMRYERLTVAA